MSSKDRTSKIMTKEKFEKVRDKYRGEEPEAETAIDNADANDVLALRLVEGSPFKVEKARVISDGKEEYVKALQDASE